MRGAPVGSSHRLSESRIIPADAGSTRYTTHTSNSSRDHPRGCGEHPSTRAWEDTGAGSSPRMRGAQGVPGHSHDQGRIIPADAGSTKDGTANQTHPTDHPRGCGEHFYGEMDYGGFDGSSPRMRGAQAVELVDRPKDGIIPADAGSTQKGIDKDTMKRDHPRGCGEH